MIGSCAMLFTFFGQYGITTGVTNAKKGGYQLKN